MTKRDERPAEPPRDEFLEDTAPGVGEVAAEPAGETNQVPVVPEQPTAHPAPTAEQPVRKQSQKMAGSVANSTWIAMIIGLLLLILLIIFIMQNQQQIELNLFAWSFEFPAGIGYLITAITGGLIVAMVGMVRMVELSRQVRKLRKQLQ